MIFTVSVVFSAFPAVANASVIVGDADGNQIFDSGDLSYVKTYLRLGWSRARPSGDVALPCTGILEPADGERLVAALMGGRNGVTVRSECHGQAIGTAVEPPPSPPRLVTVDDLFLEITNAVPEFGGLFLAEEELVVVLTDTSRDIEDQVLGEIVAVFGEERFSDLRVRTMFGEYSFSELADWKEIAVSLFGRTAVSSVDASEQRNRLVIGLDDLSSRHDVEAELEDLGVPLEAIAFEHRGLFRTHVDPLLSAVRSTVRPLRGGLVIESDGFAVCSLGFLAKRNGQRGFVTNSHCMSPIGTNVGRSMFQEAFDFEPGSTLSLSDQIGVELVDPPLVNGNSRMSDAAFVLLDPDEYGYLGKTAGSPGTPGYFGTYRITGTKASLCGDFLTRVGARSGQVGGKVTETCTDVLADWSQDMGSPTVGLLQCQTLYSAPSQNGDSGSPVLDVVSGTISEVDLVGVHWGNFGNDSVMSPIANIEAELGALEVHVQNEQPDIEFITPKNGDTLGAGGSVMAHLEAAVFDFEGEAYTVKFASFQDGDLGTGTVVNNVATRDVLLNGSGSRLLVATITDNSTASNNTDVDAVWVSIDNIEPEVWIDWPAPGATLIAGVPHQLQGSALDGFQPMPCSSLEWTLVGPSSTSFPTAGCHPTVTFESTGIHFLSLEGTDSEAATDSTTVMISVVSAPDGDPSINFESPSAGALLAPAGSTIVTATVTDLDSTAPMTVEWILESTQLIAPGDTVTLQIGSVVSGGTTSVSFIPSSLVYGHCGPKPLTMRLKVTDADNNVVEKDLGLLVHWPMC